MQAQQVSAAGCETAPVTASISPWLRTVCTGELLFINGWQELLEQR